MVLTPLPKDRTLLIAVARVDEKVRVNVDFCKSEGR